MLKLIIPPAEPPYSLANIKNDLRVLHDHQDYQIELRAKTWLLEAEKITNLVLQGVSTFELTLAGGFREIVLPKNPVTEILKVEYIDKTDVRKIFDLENIEFSYPLIRSKAPFKLNFKGVVPIAKSIIITFKAGFESMDASVEMYLNIKIREAYDNLTDAEAGKYTHHLLDDLRVNYL